MVLATVRAGANSLGSVAHSLLVGAGLIGSSPGCDAPAKHSASTGKPRDVLSPLAEQHGEGTDARQSVPTCREPHYFEVHARVRMINLCLSPGLGRIFVRSPLD